jgi:23S rRNA (cytosine1962-C5)-methyltransferase
MSEMRDQKRARGADRSADRPAAAQSRPPPQRAAAPRRPASTSPDSLKLVETAGFADYRLVDSGNGRKLERFGQVLVDRPEPQAIWCPGLDAAAWTRADATFSATGDDEGGRWRSAKALPDAWPVRVMGLTVNCRLSAFRHLGLFPEQLPHWQWLATELDRMKASGGPRPRVLNLFAYTGTASLVAARAGAEVVHVDASKKAIAWARENQSASGLGDAPIRWLLDDARKLVARELRRERRYDIVLLDPPPRGHGPGGELWEMFEHLPGLVADCARLIAPERGAIVLTAYAVRLSALSIGQVVADAIAGRAGTLECGELAIREESGRRAVAASIYARWSSHGG